MLESTNRRPCFVIESIRLDLTARLYYYMRFQSGFIFSLLCFHILLLTGCGPPPNPDGRQNVSGTIKLNGELMKAGGVVFFESLDGDSSAGGRIPVKNGQFFLTGQDGLKPGKYRVRISGTTTFDKDTNTYRTPETPDWKEYVVRLVPEEFNEKSQIEFVVTEGKKNVFDYDVITDFKPEPLHKRSGKSKAPPHPGELQKHERPN